MNLETKVISEASQEIIKAIRAALGGIFEPWQMRRIAKAEAETQIIKAETEKKIETIKGEIANNRLIQKTEAKVISDLLKSDTDFVSNLQSRAAQRFLHNVMREQDNIESVASSAIFQLEEQNLGNDKKGHIDEDWIYKFINCAKEISNTEVRSIWSRILAEQAKGDIEFSMHTLDVLRKMNRQEIIQFADYCRYFNFFGLILVYESHLGFNFRLMEQQFLDMFYGFQKLRDIGLLYNARIGVSVNRDAPENYFSFGQRRLRLVATEDIVVEPNQYLLTSSGIELSKLVDGFNPETVSEGVNQLVLDKNLTAEDINKFDQYTIEMLTTFGYAGGLDELQENQFVTTKPFGQKSPDE